jgi:Asp-tRNA(Asn)/Glu-tRNA(Gln) amidotransferase A subunit family amidase
MGLTSRDGIVPLYLDHDIGGPMARTVEDAALVLSVIAGHGPADSVTEAALGVDHGDYRRYLESGGWSVALMRNQNNITGEMPKHCSLVSWVQKLLELLT